MNEKYCKKCDSIKHVNDFTKHSKSSDGLYYLCKDCKNSERKISSRNNNEDPIKRKERMDRFKQRNPGYFNRYALEWQSRNPDKVRASKKKRTLNGKDAICSQKRKAAMQKLPRNFTTEEWKEVKIFFNNGCAYCGDCKVSLQMEHVIPLNSGGHFTACNIIPACRSCNASKRDKEMEIWYKQKSFYCGHRFELINQWLRITALRNGDKLSDTMVNARP